MHMVWDISEHSGGKSRHRPGWLVLRMGWSSCGPLQGSEHKKRSHRYSCCGGLVWLMCSGMPE